MQVYVKLFANLKRYGGGKQVGERFSVELPKHATLADVYQTLGIPEDEVKQAFVNGLVQPLDCQLNPNDEVGIFPPIGGG